MTEDPKQYSTKELRIIEKSEVLLVEKDKELRNALARFFIESGMILTAFGEKQRALDLAREKFFDGIVIDVDTPEAEAGFDLLHEFKEASPASFLILITERQTFDIAGRGFREGAVDVIAKSPDEVDYLVQKVLKLCLKKLRHDEREMMLRQTLEIHEEFLKRLMAQFRKAKELEEARAGQPAAHQQEELVILVVDEDPRTASGLDAALSGKGSFRCVPVLTGGEALDYVGREEFHLALVKDALPDLLGSMVAKNLASQTRDGIVLLFAHPGQTPGFVSVLRQGKQMKLISELKQPAQLVDKICELKEAFYIKCREKHYLQAFRREHFDFLKRYNDFKDHIKSLFQGEE